MWGEGRQVLCGKVIKISVFFNSFGLFDKEKLCASLVNSDPCSGLECHLTTAIFSSEKFSFSFNITDLAEIVRVKGIQESGNSLL